jgi:hypothetical protein
MKPIWPEIPQQSAEVRKRLREWFEKNQLAARPRHARLAE